MPTDHLRKEHPGDKSFKDSMTWQKWGFLKMGTPTFIQFIGHFFGGKRTDLPFDDDWAVQTVHVRCPTFVAPQLQQPTVEPRRQSGADCGSVWKRVTLNPKIPKIQWFNHDFALFEWPFDNGIPHFGLHKKAVTCWHPLTLTLSLSLSLSPLGKLPWVSL